MPWLLDAVTTERVQAVPDTPVQYGNQFRFTVAALRRGSSGCTSRCCLASSCGGAL